AKMAAGSGPGARELFAEGLLQFLRPAVRQLDRHVHSVRESQVELREHIDSLATGEPKPGGHPCPAPPAWGAQGAHPNPSPELCRINEDQKVALDLDPYVKKLLNARRRVVLVNNILQNAQVRGHRGFGGPRAPHQVLTGDLCRVQERLRRLNHSVAKETMRRRAMLEAGGYQGK
ncbi:SNAPN protein, partial [Donacobius atricapilla]|nr:SNAPN protein [Donacobius atricapilla]